MNVAILGKLAVLGKLAFSVIPIAVILGKLAVLAASNWAKTRATLYFSSPCVKSRAKRKSQAEKIHSPLRAP